MISKQTLRELLHSEPKEELSKFIKVIPKKKHEELQGDTMNLIQTWVHCVLYYKKIYPAEMFNMRTAYNIQVPVARPEPLKIYLFQFFEQIRMHLQHIDFIEVAVLDHSFKLSLKFEGELERSFWDEGISIQNNSKRVNSIQKEIQYKSFLADLKTTMQNGFTCQNETPWKLRIGYRMEDNEGLRKQKRQLLQKWVKKEGKGAHFLPFGCSLKTNNLNLIYESSDC